MNHQAIGAALVGVLLAVPCFAQPQPASETHIDVASLPDDFARMPTSIETSAGTVSLVPDRAGESFAFQVPDMGLVTVTLTEHSLFDVTVSLDSPLEAHGGTFSELEGIGLLNVDREGNGGETLLVTLYPKAMALRALGNTRGAAGVINEEDSLEPVSEKAIKRFLDSPIEMTLSTDGVELTITCPTILGRILTAGEEAVRRIVRLGRQLGYAALRVVETTLGVAIVITYVVAHYAAQLFRSAARLLKHVFVEGAALAKYVFVDVLAKRVIVDFLAKKVFRDIIAKKVFRDFIGKTIFRDIIAKKVFRDAIYGKFLRDWIWNGGIKRIGRFFKREFGGRTKQKTETFGAPVRVDTDGLPGGPVLPAGGR